MCYLWVLHDSQIVVKVLFDLEKKNLTWLAYFVFQGLCNLCIQKAQTCERFAQQQCDVFVCDASSNWLCIMLTSFHHLRVKTSVRKCDSRCLFVPLTAGFIYFFIGPRVYKYDYTQKQVVGIEKANSWLGCWNPVNPWTCKREANRI